MPSDRFSILELRNPHTTEEVQFRLGEILVTIRVLNVLQILHL